MEVYILDSLLRRTQVFDVFESMIWTERFADVGDFEFHIQSTFDTRSAFSSGVRIAINESYRVMTVETVEDTTDEDSKAILKISGRSIESIFEDRIARHVESFPLPNPSTYTGTPGDIIREMFYERCVVGYTDGTETEGRDKIPFAIQATSDGTNDIFPPGTLPEPLDEITWNQELDTLFNAMKNLADAHDLGFRLIRNFDNSQLIFNVYTGNDRTTRQTDLLPVIFSPNLENLQNTTEFSTIAQSKNVAVVYTGLIGEGSGTVEFVYGDGVDPEVSGFDRRVMFVDASSQIDETTVDVVGTLQELGRQALAPNRAKAYFDGELNQDSTYKYGVDYSIGDLVELRNIDGVISYKRVTEQIFVSDSSGDKSYPTLALDLFVGLNSWLSYGNKTIVWEDFEYYGYIYCGWNSSTDLMQLPAGVTLSLINGGRFDAGVTTNPRGLLAPDGLTRKVTVWLASDYVEAQLTFVDAWTGYLRIYVLASSTTEREDVVVTDSLGSQTQTMTIDYLNGAWLTFPVQVNAGGTIDIRANKTVGTYAIISGIFLDDENEGNTWADM